MKWTSLNLILGEIMILSKKILMITHMAQMLAQFNIGNIKELQSLGVEVHLAANFTSPQNTMPLSEISSFKREMSSQGVHIHQIDFRRRLGTFSGNIKCWRQLYDLCKSDDFDLIHCQSPLGGVFGRLIGRKFKIPVIYTCHGFQFFKGGPLKDWILYYPVERFLARFTDDLITINHEDDKIASNFPCKSHTYIPGVGVDTKRLNNLTRDLTLRNKLGIPKGAFVILSVGELSTRKNPDVVIRALADLKNDNIYYVAVGKGKHLVSLKKLVEEKGLNTKVFFPGFTSDPEPYYQMADVSVFPSRREGLGLAGIEAMAAGLPLLTTNSGGISDYSIDGKTGFVFGPDDDLKLAKQIIYLKENPETRFKMGNYNRKKVQIYSRENVNKIMRQIYSEYFA